MGNKVVIKGYQVGSRIDQIGLRSIYRAMSIRNGKEVFLTVVPVRPGPSQKLLLKRAEQSKKLTHPVIVSAMDFGVLPDERVYYTHPAVPSLQLASVLKEHADREEQTYRLVRTFLQVLDAVAYIHEAGTTHRDLSTNQVRVTQTEGVLLEGFVNARPKTEARNIVHVVNHPYIAPELLRGVSADARTDIYSLGMILYELLTGELPYISNYAKLEDARQGVVPVPSQVAPNVPAELDAIAVKALSGRETRYRHVGEMMQDLEGYYAQRSIRQKIKDFSSSLKRMLEHSPR